MNPEKILALLGFCRKAGKLITGTEQVTARVKSGENILAIIAEDISPKTEKELKYFAQNGKAVVIRIPSSKERLSRAIGTNAGIVATSDEGFCKAILQGGNMNEQISGE